MNANKIHHNEKVNAKDLICTGLIIFVMLLIIANPVYFSKGTIEGIKLFFFNVFPGLLPFMFLTKLLTETGTILKISKHFNKISYKMFGTPGISIYAFLMSIISGYPIGAKIIADLYSKNYIDSDDAKRMPLFCTTSGPIFVIGTVGGLMFGNKTIGIIIYLSHIISTLFVAISYNFIFRKNAKNCKFNENFAQYKPTNANNIITNCITQTINSILIVGAYITIFYLIIEILDILKIIQLLSEPVNFFFKALGINTSLTNGTIYGIIEITRGCKELARIKSFQSIALCSSLISFSGISIIFQSMAFLNEAKIKMHKFVFTKFIHSCFSYLFCILILIIANVVI